MKRSLLPALAILALAGKSARAQSVEIVLSEAGRQYVQSLPEPPDLQAVEALMEAQLRSLFGLANADEFLRLSANAQSMSNKGIGVDYATHFDKFVFGFAANLTADAGDADLETLRNAGLGQYDRAVPVGTNAQLALMLGVSLGKVGPGELMLYVNGLAYPLSVKDLDGSFYNFGAHAQYWLVSPMGTKVLFEWGGLAVTTGIEISRTRFTLEQAIERPLTIDGGLTIDSVTTGRLELVQRAFTIPLELTTGLRLLYVLSLYGGVGLDFQLGGADATFDLTSSLSADNPAGGEPIDVGTAAITIDQAGDPNRVMFRFLVGLQANIGPLKVFAQLNLHAADLTIGVSTGLRFAI